MIRRTFTPKAFFSGILSLVAILLLIHHTPSHSRGQWRRPKFSFPLSRPQDSEHTVHNTTRPWLSYNQNSAHPVAWRHWWTQVKSKPDAQSLFKDLLSPAGQAEQPSATSAYTTFEAAASTLAYVPLHIETTTPDSVENHNESKHEDQHSEHDHNSTKEDESHEQGQSSEDKPTEATQVDEHIHHGNETKLPCSESEGAEDVVFIIKTGATEVAEKLPVHFNTSLRCFPNSLIFSDYGESFEGHTIHDALGNIVDEIRLQEEDFDLWRRLNEKGRDHLSSDELSTADQTDPNGAGGNPDNGGWRLDKFKNVPMANYTVHRYPEAKWFIYTDADTYIIWSNLLRWLKQMDSTKLIYLGSPAVIGDQVFGHGGSGYVVSNALMWKAADAYNENQEEWDRYAAGHWAGDCVLATLFERLGGPLTWSFPIIQGGDPMAMDFWQYAYNRRLWCYPAVSYHHIKPQTVSSLWELEQEWTAETQEPMKHSDVFKRWVLPRLTSEQWGWDNIPDDDAEEQSATDAGGCREKCSQDDSCVQYTFKHSKCTLSKAVRVGKAADGVHSGWMLDRVKGKLDELDRCDEGDWILPDD